MNRKKKILNRILIVLAIILLINLGVVAYQTYLVETIGVKGPSMLPLIETEGSYAYLIKNFYNIERGDIIIAYIPENNPNVDENPAVYKNSISTYLENVALYFSNNYKRLVNVFNSDVEPAIQQTSPTDGEHDFKCVIKRVIGIPGDSIQINQGMLYVNGTLVEEKYIYEKMVEKEGSANYGMNNQTVELGDNEYFILGDNRNVSVDSNTYGPIQKQQILGKVFLIKQNNSLKKV